MNITFLIGNGFDLNLGLKTTYQDFLNTYLKSDSQTELIKEFKKDILRDKRCWASAEKAFGEYTELFMKKGYTAEEFCDCHEDFCINLAQYLKEQEMQIDFLTCKSELADEFAKSIAIPNIFKGFREVQTQQLERAVNSIGAGFKFNFINFNYTKTLDSCIECTKANSGILGTRRYDGIEYKNAIGQVIHVHGSTERDMVLGVNDESQIKALDLFYSYGDEYRSQIIKQKTNEMNEENIDKKAANLIQNSDLIYIYGMSIGETDALWWQRILNRMIVDGRVHVIIRCFSAPGDELLRRRLETFIKNKKEQFLSFSDTESIDKKKILNRLHIDRSNIFSGLQVMAENAKILSCDAVALG